MLRIFAISLATLIATPALAADGCTWEGSRVDWYHCVNDLAATALTEAERLVGICPDGYTAGAAGECIDLTCRGAIGDVETDVTTHAGASAACASRGARLCTMSELTDTWATGCSFDNAFLAAEVLDGTSLGFKRPRSRATDGTCPGDTSYQGIFYPDAFDEMGSCGSGPIRLSAGQVDGFLCCL